jgi:outer membrane protein assembly factor BamE (lipoprotein component of BamABCDE complex)
MKPMLALLVAPAILTACASFNAVFEARRALTDAQFAQVQYGMSREDTLRLVGTPDETMRFPLSRTQSWDYIYYDTWGYMARYSVTFDADGAVVGKVSARLNDGGDHGGK